VVGNQRFGDRAASIFRVDVRDHEPLWVGNNAVVTSPCSRTSTLDMEAAQPPKRRNNPENHDFHWRR